MEDLRSLGHAVGEYVGGGQGDTETEVSVQPDGANEMEHLDGDAEMEDIGADSDIDLDADADQEEQEDSSEHAHPLLFFFDCEATGLSIYDDHITELAAKVVGVPLSSVTQPSFSSFVHTSRNIPRKGNSGNIRLMV